MTTTAAELLAAQTNLAYYVLIDGIGYNDAGTWKQLYIFEELPSYAGGVTRYHAPGLERPDGFGESIPVMGGVGRSNGLTLRLHEWLDAGVPFFGRLFATQRWRADPASFPETRLAATFDQDDATMFVENTAGFPAAGVVFVGQDAVTYTGTTPTTFTGCASGQFTADGTIYAHMHRVDTTTEDVRPVVTTIPRTFYRRRIALYAIHRHADGTWAPLSDALLLWKGHIRSLRWQGDRQTWDLRCDSILDDLDRDVFAGPTAQSTYRGYWLGSDPENRRMAIVYTRFQAFPFAVVEQDTYQMTAAASYLGYGGFLGDLNGLAQLSAASAATRVEFEFNGTLRQVLARFPYAPAGEFIVARVQFAPAIGLVFNQATGEVSGEFSASTNFLIMSGEPPAAVFYESRASTATITVRCDPIEGLAAFRASQGDHPAGEAARAYVMLDFGEAGYAILRLTALVADPLYDVLTCTTELPDGVVGAELPPFWALAYHRVEEHPRVRQVLIPEGADVGDQLLALMKSTGLALYNGSDDLLPPGWGSAIRTPDIDDASFRSIFLDTRRRYVFARPANLRDLIEQECRLAGALVTVVGGLITARTMPTIAPVPPAAIVLDDTNTMEERERPDVEETADGFYNVIDLKTGWNEAKERWIGDGEVITDADSIEAFAQSRKFEVACRGAYGPPSVYRERLKARLLLQREPFRRIERSITRNLWTRIAAGDIVSLSDAAVPDPFTGTFSGVARGAFVEEVRTDLDRGGGRVTLRLFPIAVAGPLAPSAAVDDTAPGGGYDPAFNRLFCRAAEFSSVGTDTSYFAIGDRVLIVQRDADSPAAPLLWRRIVTAIDNGGANRIDLDAALALPAWDASRRYIVTFDIYSTIIAAQVSRGTWIADDDGRIGATTDHREWVD